MGKGSSSADVEVVVEDAALLLGPRVRPGAIKRRSSHRPRWSSELRREVRQSHEPCPESGPLGTEARPRLVGGPGVGTIGLTFLPVRVASCTESSPAIRAGPGCVDRQC